MQHQNYEPFHRNHLFLTLLIPKKRAEVRNVYVYSGLKNYTSSLGDLLGISGGYLNQLLFALNDDCNHW